MIDATAAFKALADDPQQKPAKRFSFPEDVTFRTDDVLSILSFSQEQFEGGNITAPTISIELKNDTKQLNFLNSDRANQIGIAGKVEIGFGADWITRFRGFYENPRYTSVDRPRCEMVFSGRVQKTLDRFIGSTASPVSYYAAPWNPADMAWDILTVYGDLSATASTANPDIDYTSWLSFKTICSDLFFSLRANFSGETIAEAMRLIGELVDGLIYGETDGKIYFRRHIPEETSNPYLFTDANAHLQEAESYHNKDRLRNRVIVWWGYDVAAGDWTSGGSVQSDNSPSQAQNWGIHERDFDGNIVWHDNAVSAGGFGERYVDRYGEPLDTVRFTSKRGTLALLHQVGDEVSLTWGQMDYSVKPMKIYGITGDMTRDEWEILAEDTSSLNQDFFILDSATNGEFDTNIFY